MKGLSKIVFVVGLFGLLVFGACKVSQSNYLRDFSSAYKTDIAPLHPLFKVYHANDSISTVFYSITSSELLYMHTQGDDPTPVARIKIAYRLAKSYESPEILDSGRVVLSDLNKNAGMHFITGQFSIRTKLLIRSVLRLRLTDLNRNQENESIIEVNKSTSLSAQNFKVVDMTKNNLLYKDIIFEKTNYAITYRAKKQLKLKAHFFKWSFPPALAPFSTTDSKPFEYKPDSVFTVTLNDTGSFIFTANQTGTYRFLPDSNQRDGLSLFLFNKDYPSIHHADELIPPLRYICSKDEYLDLTLSKDRRNAMENFWISCGGNKEKARELIRKYYSRVELANTYFSSYLEGWKTDRGMVFIVFGPPNNVYRTSDTETWMYGDVSNPANVNLATSTSYTFTFNKIENPFSENDFILQRSALYKSGWYNAVDGWRQGKLYFQN